MAVTWDLAGYSDAGGRLGKPIPSSHILVPGKIWAEDGFLKWQFLGASYDDFQPTDHPPSKQLLDEFARLWQAPDPESVVLAFAKKNGPMALDEGDIFTSAPDVARESINDWRRVSRKVCAMVNIAAELVAQKRRITRDEWKFIGQFEERQLDELQSPSAARFELAREVSSWLNRVGFSLKWSSGKRRFELAVDYHGQMLNAIGLQVALTIANSDSLFVCSGCGLPYPRSREMRKPNPGQANFCERCGSTEARRQADGRRKTKMIEARRLNAQGVPLNEIARRVNASADSVRRWLTKGK